uniref:DEP domain-containing protein n=1 Tax=Heterorhabditis bacteriophora TaxID=37862 RepID=A0A1I7XQI3_HETBA
MVEEFIPLSSSRLHKRRASDSTPSRISNREDILNGDKQTMHNNGKFRATRLWNDIVLRFRTDMPLKRHRRQLTFFDNSFTGREAVDFLMVELPRLLLEGREVDSFTGDYNSKCAARIPRLMQRTNSFSGGDADHVRRNVISPMRQRYICVESPLNWTPFELPKSPPKRIERFNRRLSSSHGNLTSFVATPQIFEFNSADSIAETIDSIRAEVNYSINPSPERDFKTPLMSKGKALWNDVDRRVSLTENKCAGSETEVPLPNLVKKYKSSVKIREKDSIRESAYEWLTFGRRKKNITPSKNTEQSLLDTNPLREEERNNSRKRSLRSRSERKHCVMNSSNTRLQEQDTDYALKLGVFRLRRILAVENLEFISWDIIGENVRWNCEKVGASGVVKSRNDQGKCLQNNMFSSGCSLSSQSSPFSDRHDEVTAIKMKGLSEGTQLAFQVSSDDSMRYVDGVSPSDIAMTGLSFGRRSDKLLCPLAFDDVMRLPGLKQSPDLMKTLDELCITPQTSLKTQLSAVFEPTGSMTWSDLPTVSSFVIGNTESVFQLPRDISESLLESVSLILITLPPPRRRRLHHLIRFMNKLSANHCIQLDKFRENRYVTVLSDKQQTPIFTSNRIQFCEVIKLVVPV